MGSSNTLRDRSEAAIPLLEDSLLQHIAEIDFDRLPIATRNHALIFIEDSLGVALVGHRAVFTDGLLQSLKDYQHPNHRFNAWGTELRYPAAMAAMINAYLIHAQEFDCVHEAAVVHPMAVILASVLTVCASPIAGKLVTGKEFISAIVTAVEAAALLGCASRGKMRFFRPAMCGALGAVAALAKLSARAQSVEHIKQAMGNAMAVMAGNLPGTMQAHREGAPLLPMQIAFAARNAVMSWEFAQAGLLGPKQFLSGEFGYFALHETEHDFAAALQARIASTRTGQYAINEVAHKPFPSGRATHGGLQALMQLLATLDRGVEVDHIELFAPPLICQLVARKLDDTQGINYHKLCFAFCAAMVLERWQRGDALSLGIADFRVEKITCAKVHDLAQRVQIEDNGNPDPNALSPIEVQLHVRESGTVQMLSCEIKAVLGSPEARLSTEQHSEKLRGNFHWMTCEQALEGFRKEMNQLAEQDSALSLLASLPVVRKVS